MDVSCIYKIINTIDTRIYIGSTVSFTDRKSDHRRKLIKGTHKNAKLLNFSRKYGIESLIFEIVELCEKKELVSREQYHIDTLKPVFNICKIANSTVGKPSKRKGTKCSDETRLKMSLSQKKLYADNPELRTVARNRAIGNTHRRGKPSTLKSIMLIAGANNVKSKLTDEQVNEIRKEYIPYSLNSSSKKLSEKYKVSQDVIMRAINNKYRLKLIA